jgi:hypothetical protein
MCELCLLTLGAPVEHHFKKPGPTHHARWMQKIIYVLKMNLFQQQLDLPSEIKKGLEELSLFFALVYTKSWISAPIAADASINDLNFYGALIAYKSINRKVAEAALIKFSGHLWYLTQELVPLGLFSALLSIEDKRTLQKAMIAKRKQQSVPERQRKFVGELNANKLSDLVGPTSISTFDDLGLDSNFLTTSDPATWDKNEDFLAMQAKVACIKVVNDTAERAISMISRHNGKLTKNEKTLQQNLQVGIPQI